jgi:thiamine-phosphate pyrophosphorylase
MRLKKKLLEKSRLYLILDKKVLSKRPFSKTVQLAKDSGVDIIQLRDKESPKAEILKQAISASEQLKKSKTIFLINDYPDIARIADADGVHLGQTDFSIKVARRILGNNKIIGVSCHNIRQALKAQDNGADYIGIGPVFTTSTKPQDKPLGIKLIWECQKKISIPFFVLGGIDSENIQQILSFGVKRFAICSAILQARNITKAIHGFLQILN